MFSLPFRRVVVFVLSLGLTPLILAASPQNDATQGIRIEFAAGGHVRIENQFGDVNAEVWNENYVTVAASNDGNTPLTRSPVVIENRKQLLSISIVRRPSDPPDQIKLTVKVPATAHTEIVTGKYSVALHGVPSSASLRSTSGPIDVEFRDTPNADIFARSLTGSVASTLPDFRSSNGHVLQARLGTGAKTLRVNTQSGAVSLSSKLVSDVAAERGSDDPSLEVPRKPAGTPAPAIDAQEISEGDIIRVDSQLVTLNMSVVDRNTSRGVVGLTKPDFRLFENGTEQEILQFESSSAPFDLMLLIDISGSTRDVVSLIRAAALRFVDAARPFDRIGVITFAGHATLVSPVTLNRSDLRRRINAIDTETGDTKLYDAADYALTQLLQDTKNARRTAMVVMSDGLDANIPGVARGVNDEGSRMSYADLVNRVREFDGVVYTLWLNTEYESLSPLDTQPEAFDVGHDRMKEMADAGGGVFYEVERLQDLAGAYERVVADLGTVYGLAYRPSDKARDGKWRAIRVNVDRPNAVARGKRGYYAN